MKPTGAHYDLPSVFDKAARPIRPKSMSHNNSAMKSKNVTSESVSNIAMSETKQ